MSGQTGHGISFREAFWTWVKVGLNSFGGPSGQIAVMHRILVEEKRWVSEERFLHALNYCMLLPGPEAQQLATYIGWLLHRTAGGLMAGILFVLPGFISILFLSVIYAGFHGVAWVEALFFGIKPAVLAVVIEAVIRIGRRALGNAALGAIAALAFAAIFFFEAPFPLIVLAAAGFGLACGRLRPDLFRAARGRAASKAGEAGAAPVDALLDAEVPPHTRPSAGRALRTAALWLLLWLAPIGLAALVLGRGSIFVQEGLFFSKVAVVTFGGAYAVLAYVAQEAVNARGWLQPGEMLDGLGMAETTPGPLIMVLQFVGFLGGYRNPGSLDPMLAAVLAAVVTVWVTFTPCFLWIFLGAPYIEALRGNRSLSAALSSITAAVVGVILNLAVWFALHVLFREVGELRGWGVRLLAPEWRTADPASMVLAAGAMIAMLVFKAKMIPTLAASALLGMAYHLIFRR